LRSQTRGLTLSERPAIAFRIAYHGIDGLLDELISKGSRALSRPNRASCDGKNRTALQSAQALPGGRIAGFRW
jgi:hypothetical protein